MTAGQGGLCGGPPWGQWGCRGRESWLRGWGSPGALSGQNQGEDQIRPWPAASARQAGTSCASLLASGRAFC